MQKSMPCEELVGEASGRGGGNAKDLGGHQRIRNGFCMLKEQQKGLHDWNRVSEWGVIDASKITQTVACWRLVHDGIVLFSWDSKPPRTISVIWSNPFTQQVEWHNPREVNWFKKKKVKVKSPSHVRLFVTPWTVCSLPVSSAHGIFQARLLEWVAISFSRRSSQPRDWTQNSGNVGKRFTVWATREATNW